MASTLRKLEPFNDTDVAYSRGSRTADTAGNLFGITYRGGANNDGTVPVSISSPPMPLPDVPQATFSGRFWLWALGVTVVEVLIGLSLKLMLD